MLNRTPSMASKLKTLGETYVQYPGEEPPSALFGGQWVKLFADENVFFRTEGPNAKNFNSGKQGDAIRNIKGVFGAEGLSRDTGSKSSSGALYYAGRKHGAYGGTGYWSSVRIGLDASRVVPTASENRPTNYTYRIWKMVGY